MQLKVSAPGSLMLLGEYAVLYGKTALVCAIDQRISVTLMPRQDNIIHLSSDKHGEFSTTISQLSIIKPFQFVLAVFQHYQKSLRYGCDIRITSEFSDQLGLGSSAAVTIATLCVLGKWLDKPISKVSLLRQGLKIIRQVQGVGSGADIAASTFGGLIHYSPKPLRVENFQFDIPLTVLYAGFKTPTVEAIQYVEKNFAERPILFKHLCQSIEECVKEAVVSVKEKNWKKLGNIMQIQQGLLETLGVSLPILRELIHSLLSDKNILGAKISGSGLGDCVIGLGRAENSSANKKMYSQRLDCQQGASERIEGVYTGYMTDDERACNAAENSSAKSIQQIPVNISLQGVRYEKI